MDGRVLKEDTGEYQKVKHGRVFGSIQTSIEKKIQVSIKKLNTDECVIQYGRVLKGDTDEYQKVKHRRVFESIRTSI